MAIEQVQAIIHGKKIGGQGQLTKASGITFDNTGTDLVAETAQAAIVEVNAKTSGLTRMTKLWENPAPTASFSAQTVTLASDDYDFVDVYAKVYSNQERYIWARIQKNTAGYIEMGEPSSNGADVRARLATLSGTSLTFDSGRWARNGVASTVMDSTLIPTVAYGIKII